MVSKILSYYFKRDKWILLSIFAVPAASALLVAYFQVMDLGILLSLLVLQFALFIGPIWLCIRDYKRFYGEYSSFFAGLPLTGKEIIGARLIWWLAVSVWELLIAVGVGAYILNTVWTMNAWGELGTAVSRVLGAMDARFLAVFSLLVFASCLYGVASWLFSLSVGSEKALRRFGTGGPIIVYIATNVAAWILQLCVSRVWPAHFDELREIPDPSIEIVNQVLSEWVTLGIGVSSIVCIIVSIILIIRSIYSHDKKLSAL